jgi:hypothetical protein
MSDHPPDEYPPETLGDRFDNLDRQLADLHAALPWWLRWKASRMRRSLQNYRQNLSEKAARDAIRYLYEEDRSA